VRESHNRVLGVSRCLHPRVCVCVCVCVSRCVDVWVCAIESQNRALRGREREREREREARDTAIQRPNTYIYTYVCIRIYMCICIYCQRRTKEVVGRRRVEPRQLGGRLRISEGVSNFEVVYSFKTIKIKKIKIKKTTPVV